MNTQQLLDKALTLLTELEHHASSEQSAAIENLFTQAGSNPVAIDEERYKVIDVESYETRIYTVEDRVSGDQFTITHSDSYMDPFFTEWHIVDEDCNEIIKNNDLFDDLISAVSKSK